VAEDLLSPRLIVVGTSWGGADALAALLGALPPEFPVPMAVVQHRGADSLEGVLVRFLQEHCAVPVREADDKDAIEDGTVYVGPSDYHLLVEKGSFALSVDPPVTLSRPSIDVLFESAADSYGPDLVAVVLTGANRDGTDGARAVKEQGGVVLVQDPGSATRPEMPAAVIHSVEVDEVLPLERLAARIAGMGLEP